LAPHLLWKRLVASLLLRVWLVEVEVVVRESVRLVEVEVGERMRQVEVEGTVVEVVVVGERVMRVEVVGERVR